MCIRRNSNKKNGTTQTGVKKQSCCKTCFKRCIQKIGKFCCRRITRCIKKKVLGVPNPALGDYEIGGVDLSSLKSKLNFNNKKKSAHVIFKNSIRKSKLTVKNIDLIEGLSASELKKKFSITGSKQKVLENMVEDYKKGNVSMSHLPNKSKFDVRKLDKEQVNKMLEDYQGIQKRVKNNEDLNADDIKKKFSVTGSRGKVLEKMIADYKMGKGSATGLSVKSRFDPNKLNKEQMNDMLKRYETAQKDRKRISFMGQSPSKLKGILKDVKDKVSLSIFKKTFA